MGATTFRITYQGTSMRDAFERAREQAQYEYGHGGYTGTIAEKPGFVEFNVPPGFTAETFVRWVEQTDVETFVVPSDVPKAYEATVLRAAKLYDDKWGKCVGVELTYGEALELRRKHAASGMPAGDLARFYIFAGWASE